MIVWHTCSLRKLSKYLKSGRIIAPVRAWERIEDAQRMSIRRGTRIILRLKFPDSAPKLTGHFNRARVLNTDLPLTKEML